MTKNCVTYARLLGKSPYRAVTTYTSHQLLTNNYT